MLLGLEDDSAVRIVAALAAAPDDRWALRSACRGSRRLANEALTQLKMRCYSCLQLMRCSVVRWPYQHGWLDSIGANGFSVRRLPQPLSIPVP